MPNGEYEEEWREKREQISEQIQSQKGEFYDAFETVQEEQISRSSTIRSTPTVIEWEPRRSRDPFSHGLKPPEGSLILFWAPDGSDIIPRLERAFASHDTDLLDEISNETEEDMLSRDVLSVEEAVDGLVEAPSFFELRYDGKTLAEKLWIDQGDPAYSSLAFPYNGGEISNDDLCIVEHTKQDVDCPQYETLVVKSKPVLSDLEQKVVRSVPEELNELHIGQPGDVANWATLAVVAIWVAVEAWKTNWCLPLHEELQKVGLPPELIDELGSVQSAERLLEMRQEVFEEYHGV